jgi:hypothetical protein
LSGAPIVDLRAAGRERLFDVLLAQLELADQAPPFVEMPNERGRMRPAAVCAARRPVVTAPDFDFHRPGPS